MSTQTYENYWSLTNAYTDYNGVKFRKTLKICVDFIDEFAPISYNETIYKQLNDRIQNEIPKTGSDPDASNRKAINQLVKLGFINPFLTGYHPNTKDYLASNTNRKRETILSKIVYSNSKFNAAITESHSWNQMNFLIDTLVEVGKLSKGDIIALMLVNIENVEKGFLTRTELDTYVITANQIDFIVRKYNQIGYLTNLLKKLDDIVFVNDELYFTEDAKQIFGENLDITIRKRNPYLHLIYKNQLKEESFTIYEAENCMVEKIPYPTLIASHIKPFIKSTDDEAYDPNNGILLSRNIDSLFDLGYITFEDDGTIKFANSERLKQEVIDYVSNYSLDNRFINEKRLEYLEYHRNEVFEKRYKYA